MAKCDHGKNRHQSCPWCGNIDGGAEASPRAGDLRFEGMGADSKMFAFLQPWSHAEGAWYEVKLPAPEVLQQAVDSNIRRAGGVPPGNVGSYGGWPTCSECGYTGYMVTKLMGHQATAYMCPVEGCGHLTPIPNRGGMDGPPMGWITGLARVVPLPLADFSINKDGEIEPLSDHAKKVWTENCIAGWTNLDDDGVASGEAKDIRLTPNPSDGSTVVDIVGEEPCG